MDEKQLTKFLLDFQKGNIDIAEAVKELKDLPFKDIGFAKVDYHRELRKDRPEVVLCEGKSLDQIEGIIKLLGEKSKNVLATRASREVYEKIKNLYPTAKYYEQARIIIINEEKKIKNEKTILVITAGTSDIRVAEEAVVTAEAFGNKVDRLYDVGVAGLHRLLYNLDKLRQANVLIVVAGMEGALASVVGGLVNRPVIAVPTSVGYGTNFGGLTALLSMLNSCSDGIGVVNIDNGFGAASLAHQINSSS
ncbi:hypothetical protein SAMN00017405_1754 [Desulfonispora thiosulfatigenes DSM 11270]|uniref:PurE domain-containing protein n=1 Tax=Desulfonispora thiosulfatigenes DSM 11270 TaxID=656914 RepID=A0A1W1V2Y8_DESTI|nr:nickel pincer cofactor biosynthesis protein LarB [Desulfonispora thiosulfatigenes]SMB87747.1 hypothetical protein SAMN00017405_1754 [Desulfonispora thiosulfatigenes DSM 11270]